MNPDVMFGLSLLVCVPVLAWAARAEVRARARQRRIAAIKEEVGTAAAEWRSQHPAGPESDSAQTSYVVVGTLDTTREDEHWWYCGTCHTGQFGLGVAQSVAGAIQHGDNGVRPYLGAV